MQILLLIFIALFCLQGAVWAQSISPVVQECGRKCSGEFVVTNNEVIPMATTVDLFAFTYVEGKPRYGPLPAGMHVEMSETSARIPPRASHEFAYRIRCDTLPCAVGIQWSMVHGHVDGGVVTGLRFITTVYQCEKQRGCRDSVRKSF